MQVRFAALLVFSLHVPSATGLRAEECDPSKFLIQDLAKRSVARTLRKVGMLIVSLGLLGAFPPAFGIAAEVNRKAIWMANATYNIGKERNYAYWWALEEIDKASRQIHLPTQTNCGQPSTAFAIEPFQIELP